MVLKPQFDKHEVKAILSYYLFGTDPLALKQLFSHSGEWTVLRIIGHAKDGGTAEMSFVFRTQDVMPLVQGVTSGKVSEELKASVAKEYSDLLVPYFAAEPIGMISVDPEPAQKKQAPDAT